MRYTTRSWSSDLTADICDTNSPQGPKPRAQITRDMDCHKTEELKTTELTGGENILESKAVSRRHFTELARLHTHAGALERRRG